MARIFHRRRVMPDRQRLRALLAATLLASLFPFGLASSAPAPAIPVRCGTPASPSACPSCPADGRPCCPAPQPARSRACCVPAALPAGASERESRPSDRGTADSADAAKPRSAIENTAAGRRDVVTAASPPVRLLGCTFRN